MFSSLLKLLWKHIEEIQLFFDHGWIKKVSGPHRPPGHSLPSSAPHCLAKFASNDFTGDLFHRWGENPFVVTKRHRDTETQRLRDTETRRLGDSETQRDRDSETQRHRDSETQGHRDSETQRLRDKPCNIGQTMSCLPYIPSPMSTCLMRFLPVFPCLNHLEFIWPLTFSFRPSLIDRFVQVTNWCLGHLGLLDIDQLQIFTL